MASKLGPSRSAVSTAQQPRTAPLEISQNIAKTPSPASQSSATALGIASSSSTTRRSPGPQTAPNSSAWTVRSSPTSALPPQQQQPAPQQQTPAAGTVWSDLISLQLPPSSSSLPLQYQTPQSFGVPSQQNFATSGNPQNGLSISTGNQPAYANMSMTGMGTSPYQGQQQQFTPSSLPPQYQQSFTPAFSASPSMTSYPVYQQQQQQFFNSQQAFNQSPVMQSPGPTGLYPQQQPIAAPQAQMFNQFPSPSLQPMHLSITPQLQGQYMNSSPQPQGQGQFMTPSPQLIQGQGQFLNSSPQSMQYSAGGNPTQPQQMYMQGSWAQPAYSMQPQSQWGSM